MSGGIPPLIPAVSLWFGNGDCAAVVERRGDEVLQKTNSPHDALDDSTRLVIIARRGRRGQHCNYGKEKSKSER